MLKNSYKFLFLNSMIFGSLIAISSTSWMSIWMGLEINLLSFIPLMMVSKNLLCSESSLKYFLTQALASSIFLFLIILYFMFSSFKLNLNFISMAVSSTMMLKMGAAPFHFWFPSVMEGLTWNANLMLMTWQKIAPLMITSYMMNFNLIIISIFMAMLFGNLGGLNQTSLRKMMAFSSINHLGWMFASMIFNQMMWFSYFLFYTFLNISVIYIFMNFKILNLNQTFSMYNSNQLMKICLFMSLLSLGGLPPFLGFFPKWMIIEMMIMKKMFILLNFMLFMTLISLYFYLRISYSSILLNHTKMNWMFKNNFNKKNFMILFICFLTLFGLILMNNLFIFI